MQKTNANEIQSSKYELIRLSQKKSSAHKSDLPNQEQFMKSISLARSNRSKKSTCQKQAQPNNMQSPRTQVASSKAFVSKSKKTEKTSRQNTPRHQTTKNKLLLTVQEESQPDITNSVIQVKQNNRLYDTSLNQQSNQKNIPKQHPNILHGLLGSGKKIGQSTLVQKIQENSNEADYQSQQNMNGKQSNLHSKHLRKVSKQFQKSNLVKSKRRSEKQQLGNGKFSLIQVKTNEEKESKLNSKGQNIQQNRLRRRKTECQTKQNPRKKKSDHQSNQLSDSLTQQNKTLTIYEVENHPLYKKLMESRNQMKIKYETIIKEMEEQINIMGTELQLREKEMAQQSSMLNKQKLGLQTKIEQYIRVNQSLQNENQNLVKKAERIMSLNKQLANMTPSDGYSGLQGSLEFNCSFQQALIQKDGVLELHAQNLKLKRKLILFKAKFDEVSSRLKSNQQEINVLKQMNQKAENENQSLRNQMKGKNAQIEKLLSQIKATKQVARQKMINFESQLLSIRQGLNKKTRSQEQLLTQRTDRNYRSRLGSDQAGHQNMYRKTDDTTYNNSKWRTQKSGYLQTQFQAVKTLGPEVIKSKEFLNQYEIPKLKVTEFKRLQGDSYIDLKMNKKLESSGTKERSYQRNKHSQKIKEERTQLYLPTTSKLGLLRKQSSNSNASNNSNNSNNNNSKEREQLNMKRIKSNNQLDRSKNLIKQSSDRARSPDYQYLVARQKHENKDINLHSKYKKQEQEYGLVKDKKQTSASTRKPENQETNYYKANPIKSTSKGSFSLHEKLQKLKRQLTNQIETVKNLDRKKQNSYGRR